MEVAVDITVNSHAYSWNGQPQRHEGHCTPENCHHAAALGRPAINLDDMIAVWRRDPIIDERLHKRS
jgi:hypothetical protein